MIALPTGDSFESLFSAGFASAEPTMWYSNVCFALTSRIRTFDPTETVSFEISFFVITRADSRRSSSWAILCSSIACSFFASSYSAFSAMSPNSRATRMRSATSRRFSVCRNSISCLSFSYPSAVRTTSFRAASWEKRARIVAAAGGLPQGPRYPCRAVQVDLSESWYIGGVEIPTRLVLAPMAGVSVQAFRRQGRRFGAGLVCSEMVSVAGIQHRNERTLGYLRAGADIVDINFGCPVKKVTKTGAGASLLDDPDHAARIVSAVAGATALPVSVKMRRGTANGSRDCLVVGPLLVDAGAASLTLHPRSARQMYTGFADHALTAELVELVD